MVSFLYRAVIALIGLTPIIFAILCTQSSNVEVITILSNFAVAFGACFLARVLLIIIFYFIKRNCNTFRLDQSEIATVNPKRGCLQLYFMAYLMPLFLGDSSAISFVVFCILGLIIASLFDNSIVNNPMIYTLGYQFYEIQTNMGITYLLISKKSPQNIVRGIDGIIYDDNTVIQGESSCL